MVPAPDIDDDSVGAVIVQVAEDAKAYAAAQVALYKAVATVRLNAAKSGLVFGAAAATLAMAALGALLMGLILTLAPLVGPLAATAIVVLVVLAIAAVLGWLCARRLAGAFGDIG